MIPDSTFVGNLFLLALHLHTQCISHLGTQNSYPIRIQSNFPENKIGNLPIHSRSMIQLSTSIGCCFLDNSFLQSTDCIFHTRRTHNYRKKGRNNTRLGTSQSRNQMTLTH
jgi:hypothetical protein